MTLAHQSEVPEQSTNRGIYSCFSKSDGFDHKIRFDHLIGIYIWHLQSDWAPLAGAYFTMDCFVSFAHRKTAWNSLTQSFQLEELFWSRSDCWGQCHFHNYSCPHFASSAHSALLPHCPIVNCPRFEETMDAARNYQLPHLQRFAQNCAAHFAQCCKLFCDKCGLGNVEKCWNNGNYRLSTCSSSVQGLTRDQTSAISSSED